MNLRPAFITGVVVLAAIVLIQVGCEQPTTTGNNGSTLDSNSISSSGTVKLDGQIISIPSPTQLAILVQQSNLPFKAELLNDLSKRDLYLDEYKKSMNLGVYGADLIEHIDGKLVSRLNSNISQRDSVLKLSSQFFHSADKYLKNSQRSDLAGLILLGGWIESLHLAMDAASVNPEVKKRIGEQKHACQSLNALLQNISNPALDPLKKELNDLNKLYEKLESTYTYSKPITDAKEKTTYFTSKSSVNVSVDQLAEIKAKIENIRTIITQ
jgi:hypothetical protein